MPVDYTVLDWLCPCGRPVHLRNWDRFTPVCASCQQPAGVAADGIPYCRCQPTERERELRALDTIAAKLSQLAARN